MSSSLESQLGVMPTLEDQEIADALISLHNLGFLDVQVAGVNEKGSRIIRVKVLKDYLDVEQQFSGMHNMTAH